MVEDVTGTPDEQIKSSPKVVAYETSLSQKDLCCSKIQRALKSVLGDAVMCQVAKATDKDSAKITVLAKESTKLITIIRNALKEITNGVDVKVSMRGLTSDEYATTLAY